MQSGNEDFELLVDDHQSVIGVLGRLFISITINSPTVESVQRFERLLSERVHKTQDKQFLLVVPSSTRPRLPGHVRSQIGSTWEKLEQQIAAAAVWIRRDSFVGSIHRSLVTAILLARRGETPTQVVATARDAIRWFSLHDDGGATPDDYGTWARRSEELAQRYDQRER